MKSAIFVIFAMQLLGLLLNSFRAHDQRCLFVILVAINVVAGNSTEHAQFYGGSMSFEIEKVGSSYKASIKILTAWKIGYGPCGTTCSYSDVGRSTNISRTDALSHHDAYYLGQWLGERQIVLSDSTLTGNTAPIYMDMNDEVIRNIKEKVQLVNEKLKWEMEQAEISVTVPAGTDYIDIKFNGSYWVNSSLIQTRHTTKPLQHAWFMQTKVRTATRSDTGRSNRSPVLQTKPYYRLVMNETHEIKITYIDQDNDIVRCQTASTGTSRGIKPPKGLTMNEKDCVIKFKITSKNYKLKDTGIVLIEVLDFNKKDMTLGTGKNALRFAGNNLRSRSLSSVPLQFYFEVVDHLDSPEFIDPTPPHRQLFEIFVGAKFSIDVFARPTDMNNTAEIEKFFFLRRDGIKVVTGSLLKRPEVDPRAKSMMVTWVPKPTETGNHALCANVVDSIGEEAFALHCFTITVRDIPTKPVKPLIGQPYFIQFPADEDIYCKVNSICRFPIYAKTDNVGGITDIIIIHKEILKLKVEGQMTQAPNRIDSNAQMIEISFQDFRHGSRRFCVKASDRFKSVEQCTLVKIIPEDPCLSSPCENSGECISKEDGTFQCVCLPSTFGQTCEQRIDPCKNIVCDNGGTCYKGGFCGCTPGVTGMRCENVISACQKDTCHGYGMCIDKPGQTPDHDCQCTNLYTGQECTTNPFPFMNCSITPNNPSCSDCNLQNNTCNTGKCIKKVPNGHYCICPQGFTGQNCETAIDTIRSGLNGKFVSPTLATGSVVTCDPLSGGMDSFMMCEFPVYVFWDGTGKQPIVESTYLPKDVLLDGSSKKILQKLKPASIAGLNQTLIGTVILNGIRGKTFKNGLHTVCFVVKQGTTETDKRCFNMQVDFQTIKIHGLVTTDDRFFVSPTLPEKSVIVCAISTPCHINVYTTYKYTGTHCKNPLFPNTAPCTVFGAIEMKLIMSRVCHSDIVYNAAGLMAGSRKDICFKASDGGETRCFIIHVVEKIQDPCQPNPCENNGLCSAALDGTHSCVCRTGFFGDNCQIGTCPPPEALRQDCQKKGHCHTDGLKQTCFCRLGTKGTQCEHETNKSLTNPAQEGAKFTGSSIPAVIKCHIAEPCLIPTVLTGDPHKKPSMTKGYVDSGVEIQGVKVTQDKNDTHIYHSVTTVLPKKTGTHRMCLQSLNAANKTSDEVCYSVEVVPDSPKPASVKKPMFMSPTLPDGSSIKCSVGKPCHLILWMKNHAYEPLCPRVISDLNAQDGVYVFPTDKLQSPCSTDVSIHTEAERTIHNCFALTVPRHPVMHSYGGDGEKRCYDIRITKEPLSGPCSSLRCDNEGFCNGKESTGFCQCLLGYSGPHCEVLQGNTLTAPNTQTKPKFGDHVIPKKVVCVLHEECSVPFTVTSSTQPVVKPGHVDEGLTTRDPTITPDPNNPGTFISSLKMVGTTPGTHKVCVQTGQTVGNTNDEVCFQVEVKTPESSHHKIKKNQPYFVDPTITHDSITQCVPGKSCHILMFMNGGVYPDCPSIKQTQGPTDDLHLFTSEDNSKIIGNCTADVTLTPPTGSTGKHRFCFNAFLPNVLGETRCFYVEYLAYKAPNPTCIGHDCHHRSMCDFIGGQPECICALSQSGSQCEKDGSAGPAHLATQPKITDYPLPKLVKCQVGTTCQIPMLVTAGPNKNIIPVVTSTTIGSPNITQTPPSVTKETRYPDGVYKVTIPVQPTTQGQHKVCVKLQQPAGDHCFTVEAFTNPTPTPAAGTSGHFVDPSMPPESTVVCVPGSTCHLIVFQKPNNNSLCNPVIGQSVPGGAHIVTPPNPNGAGLCETDIIYKPTTGAKSQRICVKAMGDNNGNTGESLCYKVDPSMIDIDPCQSVDCHTGDCVVSGDSIDCKCPIGTTGKHCDQDTKNLITGNTTTKPAFVDTVKPKKVVCYTGGSHCGIPVAVINNGSQSPTLHIDHPSKNLSMTIIPGTNTSQAIVNIPSSTSGNKTVCVDVIEAPAGSVKDKLCYDVEVKQGPPPTQTESKFTDNTLGPNSEVSCETGITCHLIIETTPEGGKCPKILNEDPSSQNKKISEVYVFKPKNTTLQMCKTDVAIKPSNVEIGNKEICVKIEKSSPVAGDKRCYKVAVIKGDSCKPIQCLNGGICEEVDKHEGIAVCICPTGFSGNRCQTAHGNPLTPLKEEEIPTEEKKKGTPKFIETSIPETITCIISQPCHLPLKITDQTGLIPSLGFGHVDAGIITSPPKVTPSGNKTYTTDVVVTPTKLGRRKVCVQTKNSENVNMDEVCYNIETTDKEKPTTGTPKFTEPTIKENSVMICQPGQTCHIPLTYEKKSGQCENVTETIHTAGVHVFQANSQNVQTCQVDVGFTPKPDEQGTSRMCFKAGSSGEKRCITIKVEETSSLLSTPCQSHHCHRNGFCSIPYGSQAVCTCTVGSTGPYCKNDSTKSIVPGSHGQEPKFVDTVLPREVKCYKDQPCLIPFTVKGNNPIKVGDTDPGLNPVIKPSQKIVTTDGVYQHSLSVTPHTDGKKSVCVKTNSTGNKEQICFTIDVVDPPTNTQTSPKYIGTTLGPDSTVDCQTETLCHLQVQTEKENGSCPSVLEKTEETSLSIVHVFPPESSSCTTDVAFKPMVTEIGQNHLCLHINSASSSDTKRCFKVMVSNKKDPCVPVYCQNKGECEITGNTGKCICPAGYTGNKCQIQKSEKITPVILTHLTPEQPHFSVNAVPKIIKCVQDVPCHVPLTVTEPNGHVPTVKFGKVDPGLETEQPILTPVNGTTDFTTAIIVTPQKPGTKTLCVQTQTSQGLNVDEICYQVQTSSRNQTLATRPMPTGIPVYTHPTVTDSSTLICETGHVCHIPLTYKGVNGKCVEIDEIPSHENGVHIFKPPVQPTTTDKTCTTDISYKPMTDGTMKLCFKTGSNGEKRCLYIESKDKSHLSTPCQELHCTKGGDCIADINKNATCVCPIGTSGRDCREEPKNSITDINKKVKPLFTDTVLPQKIVCYKHELCTIPFVVTEKPVTNSTGPKVVQGQIDPALSPQGPSHPTLIPNTHSYTTELKLTPNVTGEGQACVQTEDSGNMVDEICVKIDVQDRPTAVTVALPKFTQKTLKPDSIIACRVNNFCHLQMETTLKPDGKCPTISRDNSTMTVSDVHPMNTQKNHSNCLTDVVLHPTKLETGLKTVCIQINISPSEGPRCYMLNVTDQIDPCVPVYCQNKGECEITGNIGKCICPAGYTGNKCQIQKSKKITPVILAHLTPEQPHFSVNAVPKIIKCVQDVPCHVPLTVTEPNGHVPTVKFGKVDPGLETEQPILTPVNGTTDFTTAIVVTPQKPGTKTLCVQTQTSQGLNVDEICYQVQTSSRNQTLATRPMPTGIPVYTHPTVTDSSTLICETGHVCHIPLTYKGVNGKCVEIDEIPSHENGVHIFKPPVQPTTTDKTCTTDIAYKPMTGGTMKLCFKTGSNGEKRCLYIESKDKSHLSTPCQELHCTKGGDCIADIINNATCVCPIGTSGRDCREEPKNSITDINKKVKPLFTDTVLPQKIVCYKHELCTIPFVVTEKPATNSTGPKVVQGQIDPALSPQGPSHPTLIPNTHSYTTELKLTPNVTGEGQACVQTEDSGNMVDEICVKIDVQDRPTAVTVALPKFTQKTLKPDSIIACRVNNFCHLQMETTLKPDGKCPTISRDNSTMTVSDVHPMNTQKNHSNCLTDVVLHPTKLETGLKTVCIQINISPSEGPRCYMLNVTDQIEITTTVSTSPSTVTSTTSTTKVSTTPTNRSSTTTTTKASTTATKSSTTTPTTKASTTTPTTMASTTTPTTKASTTIPTTMASTPTTKASTTTPTTTASTTTPTTKASTTTPTTMASTTTPTTKASTTTPTTTASSTTPTTTASTTPTTMASTTKATTMASTTTPTTTSSTTKATTTASTTPTTMASTTTPTTTASTTKATTTASTTKATTTASTTPTTMASTTTPTTTASTTKATTMASTTTLPTTPGITGTSTPLTTDSTTYHSTVTSKTTASKTTPTAKASTTKVITKTSSTTPGITASTTTPHTTASTTTPRTTYSTTTSRTTDSTTTSHTTDSTTKVTTVASAKSSPTTPGSSPSTTSNNPAVGDKNLGQCSQLSPTEAMEAVKMGRVTCTCVVNGKKTEIIRQNPKATTEQLFKAAGIGAGSVSGAMVIAWLIYMLVSKVKGNKQSNLSPTPRPRKITPFRKKSVDLVFT